MNTIGILLIVLGGILGTALAIAVIHIIEKIQDWKFKKLMKKISG